MPLISRSLNLRVYLSTRVSLDTQQALLVRYSEIHPHDCGYGCAYHTARRMLHASAYAERIDVRGGVRRVALRRTREHPSFHPIPCRVLLQRPRAN